MEPTIYKPSIYKGAGIYKAGDEGGGGVYDFSKYKISCVRDIDIDGLTLKAVNENSYAATTDLIALDGKSFEIQIRCKITYIDTARIPILGFVGGANYLSTSLQYDTSNSQLWMGVPNADNSSWQSPGWVDVINCNDNEFHTYKIRYNKDTKTVTTILDNGLVHNYTCVETPRQQNTRYAFGRNFDAARHGGLDVDMENTYIKDNDSNEIIFGLITVSNY